MPLYEFFQRNRHLLLNSAGVVNMAGDVEQLCARVPLSAKTQKPRASTTTDGRCHRYSLHIGNSCGTTKHTFKVEDKRNISEDVSNRIPKHIALHSNIFSPTSAGNGGFKRGFPCFPSRDSIRAVSSPQMYAPAPRITNTSKS